ncbi:MAG TPA: hypothetical protein VH088_12170, partial [Terriglobales bacterium]|nr:hypothetical protein [Terriglobales bacterium]
VPALAIPVERKDEFVCPEFHVEEFEKRLPSVSQIITVGWSATEQHFLGMLGNAFRKSVGPHVLVVSGNEEGAHNTIRNLSDYRVGKPGLWLPFNAGFSQFTGGLTALRSFLGCL